MKGSSTDGMTIGYFAGSGFQKRVDLQFQGTKLSGDLCGKSCSRKRRTGGKRGHRGLGKDGKGGKGGRATFRRGGRI